MSSTRKQIIWIAAVVIVLALGLFLMPRRGNAPASGTATTTPSSTSGYVIPTTTSQADKSSGGIAASPVNVEYTVVNKGDWSITPVPDFRTPITFAPDTTSAVKSQLNADLAQLSTRLAADPKDFVSWVNLGMVHKSGGDYQFAATVWEYLAKVLPASETPFYNLGDLYENFLKDYPKAEANYLKAIADAPHDTGAYRSLFTMYAYQYKQDTSSAEDILKKGIAANPKAVDLQVVLAEYYRSKSRTADANAEYDAAIANAKAQGLTQIAADIEAEKNSQ